MEPTLFDLIPHLIMTHSSHMEKNWGRLPPLLPSIVSEPRRPMKQGRPRPLRPPLLEHTLRRLPVPQKFTVPLFSRLFAARSVRGGQRARLAAGGTPFFTPPSSSSVIHSLPHTPPAPSTLAPQKPRRMSAPSRHPA